MYEKTKSYVTKQSQFRHKIPFTYTSLNLYLLIGIVGL